MSLLPSLLFPWFIAGVLAVSLPIVFHLIRRSPSGQTQFSTRRLRVDVAFLPRFQISKRVLQNYLETGDHQ